MAEIHIDDHDLHEEPTPPTGEELASRLFSLVMAGVTAVILFMIVMSQG